ncbi:deiodinase family protein [Tautonia rosea]|uniref:deiodinase family protein n=1 Tax=Tautonia rosea TaxID=2728037 RepID=UPI0014747214|nr:deiodinase family protein [Tautonia rosea]
MNQRFPIGIRSRTRWLAPLAVGSLVLTLGSRVDAQEASGNGAPRAEMAPEARAFWDSELAGRLGNWLIKRMEETPAEDHPEWLLMLTDILRGSQLNATDGWFRRPTGGSRYSWEDVRNRLDRDGDGFVARQEWPGTAEDFVSVDRTGDGLITRDDFDWSEHALAGGPGTALFYLADTDGNGKVGRAEFLALFERLDRGDLGFLSRDELKGVFDQGTFSRLMMEPGIKGEGPPPSPEGPSKSTLVRGLFTQEIGSLWPGPAVGDRAPDFTLGSVDGDRDVTLSSYRERLDRPIVLIFGNFTCGPFRSQAGNIEKIFRRYRDRAGFLLVYVREAHPTDGWHMFDNFRQGYTLPQPTDDAGRVEVARLCRRTLDLAVPMVVDSIEDPVGTLYSGMPARLYLIDRTGEVVFKSGRGPFGFKPAELEQALALLLMDEAQSSPQVDDEATDEETR